MWSATLLLAAMLGACHKSDARQLQPPTQVMTRIGVGQVTLSWSPAQGASGYNVYWSQTKGVTPANGQWANVANSPFTAFNLTNGTPYYFIVTSVDGGGESAASAEVSATPHIPEWTWAGGPQAPYVAGVYGTRGVASPSNGPGAREGAASWVAGGALWLFGGHGYDLSSNYGLLNDLWKYDLATGEWTFVSGATNVNVIGVYGTQGTAGAANGPGGRNYAVSWSDPSGTLWLFGGSGLDSVGGNGYLNDLWSFNPQSNQWTWVSGSKTTSAVAVYGTQGTAAASNVPSARSDAVGWSGGGRLWLFGGYGYTSTASTGYLNDLWSFDESSGEWTWIAGTNSLNVFSVYGTKGLATPSNMPGGRQGAVSWSDINGNLWLFGGSGYDSSAQGYLNDLWMYNPPSQEWTWISGSSVNGSLGSYGIRGQPSTSNAPASRTDAVAWRDGMGDLWLFGGIASAEYNDLWRFNPGSNQWTWVSGSQTTGASASYGTLGVPAPSNVPGARVSAASWQDRNGSLWLFGGAQASSQYSDLWQWNPVP